MHDEARGAFRVIGREIGQVAFTVEQQLSRLNIDHPQRERNLVGAALLLALPLLHTTDDDGLRTHQPSHFEHVGVVCMRQLYDLFFQHLVELRAFDHVDVEVEQERGHDSGHTRPGPWRARRILQQHDRHRSIAINAVPVDRSNAGHHRFGPSCGSRYSARLIPDCFAGSAPLENRRRGAPCAQLIVDEHDMMRILALMLHCHVGERIDDAAADPHGYRTKPQLVEPLSSRRQ